MDDLHKPSADGVARARTLIARAARGVEQLEDVAGQAFCRLTALIGMLARLEELASSGDPNDVDAAALDAATVHREAKKLLRFLDSRQWNAAGVPANRKDPARRPALLPVAMAGGD
jgi:hypothetical protein